jgi:sigma-B regulation protein RsbU (phosphoserine phosphatase)
VSSLEMRSAREARTRWGVVAGGIVLGFFAADVILGREIDFGGVLAIGPFVASAGVGVVPTLAVGALASCLVVILGLLDTGHAVEHAVRTAGVIASSGLAGLLAARRVRREDQLTDLARVADVAQRAILADVAGRIGDFAVASRYVSASREARVGGDFYEAIEVDGVLRIVVGDVRGKGLDAVRLAAVVLGAFREAAQSVHDVTAIACLMDERVSRHLEGEEFVTVVLADLAADGRVSIVNCGHHPPLHLHGGRVDRLVPAAITTPLGLSPKPSATFHVLRPGDRLFFYTDGLTEARTPDGDDIDLEDVQDALWLPDLGTALAGLLSGLTELVAGQFDDDLALLLLEYCGRGDGQVTEGA